MPWRRKEEKHRFLGKKGVSRLRQFQLKSLEQKEEYFLKNADMTNVFGTPCRTVLRVSGGQT